MSVSCDILTKIRLLW